MDASQNKTRFATAALRVRSKRIARTVAVLPALVILCGCMGSNPTKTPTTVPCIAPMADSAVSVNDSVVLHVSSCDDKPIYACFWSFDGGVTVDLADGGLYRKLWTVADTGRKVVLVRALGHNSLESQPDTIVITVLLNPPSLTLRAADTVVFVHDTLTVHASASDPNGTITSYRWSSTLSSPGVATAGSAVFVPCLADTGVQVIRAWALDDDSLESAPDSLVLFVRHGRPWVLSLPDTALSAADTLRVCVAAGDSNGAIERYLWDYDGGGWDDTVQDSCHCVTYRGTDSATVLVAAQDVDGLLAATTFHIVYNLPPAALTMYQPADPHTYSLRDSSFIRKEVVFRFGATDPDGPDDSLQYGLWVGLSPASMSLAYSGADTFFSIAPLDTALYYWRLTARDVYGNTSVFERSFVCALQKDICFMGHSIVTGLGGNAGKGGFRAQVLDTIRGHFGPHQVVNCVGPFVTGKLDDADDDSCHAVSGASSWELLDSLKIHPTVNADMWIFMVGVNGDYGYWERYYTRQIVDTLLARNPESYAYVLNGLPFPDTVSSYRLSRLYAFNDMLDTLIANRQAQGLHVRLVDAYTAFAPDSSFNEALFFDEFHPNQSGYDVLAGEVLRVMKLDW